MLFHELYALASRCTLSMLVDANAETGLMTISVRPQPKSGQAAGAPSEPLTLTATPAEFDTGFAGAFGTYRTVLDSLQAQADAAAAQLRSKSAKATAKPAHKTPPTAAATSAQAVANAEDGSDGEHGEGGDGGQPQGPAPADAKPAAAPAQSTLFD